MHRILDHVEVGDFDQWCRHKTSPWWMPYVSTVDKRPYKKLIAKDSNLTWCVIDIIESRTVSTHNWEFSRAREEEVDGKHFPRVILKTMFGIPVKIESNVSRNIKAGNTVDEKKHFVDIFVFVWRKYVQIRGVANALRRSRQGKIELRKCNKLRTNAESKIQ